MGHGAQLDRLGGARTRVTLLDGVSLSSPPQRLLSPGEKGDWPRLGRGDWQRIGPGAATVSQRVAYVGEAVSAGARGVVSPAAARCFEGSRWSPSTFTAQNVLVDASVIPYPKGPDTERPREVSDHSRACRVRYPFVSRRARAGLR